MENMRSIDAFKIAQASVLTTVDPGRTHIIDTLIQNLEQAHKCNDNLSDDIDRLQRDSEVTCRKLKQSEYVLLAENERLSAEVSRLSDNLATSEQQLSELHTTIRVLKEEIQSMHSPNDAPIHNTNMGVTESPESN